jgi:hypothetical protein
LAFWAVGRPKISFYPISRLIIVGFKWSIIDYAQKIEDLFAKMEGVRARVLPPNREAVDKYFATVWMAVHTLTAAVSPLSSELDATAVEHFKLHLDSEEARLGNNLRAVNYIIDGMDTVTLITEGRIEKVRTRQRILHLGLILITIDNPGRLSTAILADEAPL